MSSRDTLTESEVEHALALGLEQETPWLPEVARDNLRLRGIIQRNKSRHANLKRERDDLMAAMDRMTEKLEGMSLRLDQLQKGLPGGTKVDAIIQQLFEQAGD